MSKKKKEKPTSMAADLAALTKDEAAETDARVQLLRKENKSLKTQMAKRQAESDIIISHLDHLFEDRPILVDVPPKPAADRRKSKHEEIAVLSHGDTHYGHYCSEGKYAYSIDQAREMVLSQFAPAFLDTVRDRRSSARIEECRLYLIGDMVEGENMRPGHAHSIECPVIEQAMIHAPSITTALIMRLLEDFRKLKIVAVPGNHGRNGTPKGGDHPLTNWDRVAFETTRHMVTMALNQKAPARADDIEWDLPTDRQSADGDDWIAVDYCYDWCNAIMHGENLRGKGWGGLPFYGIERMVRRVADISDDPIDYLYHGHVHVHAEIPSNFRKVFVNGAVEPSTVYARKELVAATTPSQSAVFYTKAQGPISRHEFYLGERLPHGTRIKRALDRRS